LVAAPCSQWIARSPVRKWHRGGPLNKIVMQHRNFDYSQVVSEFQSGGVLSASRVDLEQMLLAIGRERIVSEENRARAAEMGETIRQVLAARQSQELHGQTQRVAWAALIISVAALIAGVIQALAALNIIEPVKSSPPQPAVAKASK